MAIFPDSNLLTQEYINHSLSTGDTILETKAPHITLPAKCIIILKGNRVIEDIEVEDISCLGWSKDSHYSFLLLAKQEEDFQISFRDSYLIISQDGMLPFKFIDYDSGDIYNKNANLLYKPCPPKEILPVLQATGLIKIEEELCSQPKRDEMEEIRNTLNGPSLLDLFKEGR